MLNVSRLLALLALLQSRPVLDAAPIWSRGSASPPARRARTSSGCASSGYPVDATRGPAAATGSASARPAAAAAARATTRRSPSRSASRAPAGVTGIEGRSASRAGQAGAGAAAPAAAPGPSHPRQHRRRAGQHRHQRSRIRRSTRTCSRSWPPPSATAQGVRFTYDGGERPVTAEPYRLVSWQRRWYLVAREQRRPASGASFRVDWMRLRVPGAARFAPRPLPGGDYTSFVLRDVAVDRLEGPRPHPRRRARRGGARPDQPRRRRGRDRRRRATASSSPAPTASRPSPSGSACSGSTSTSTEPPELVEHLRVLARRYQQSV